MNICIGLGVFPILSIVLDRAGFPLDVKYYLVLSLLVPLYELYRRYREDEVELDSLGFKVKFNKELAVNSIVVLIAVSTLTMLSYGAFGYPWIEDGDGWRHAGGVKYLAVKETYGLPEGVPVSDTLQPYPPTYDGAMALMHQLNPSIRWSMKYFTSLLAALGLIGFYFFTKRFTGRMELALISTFILACMPGYPSHFIWAYTMGYILFFPALYSIEHVDTDKKWMIPSIIQVASLMVIQALIAPTFGIILILYWIIKALKKKEMQKKVFTAGLVGLLLALGIYWIPMYQQYWGREGAKLNRIDKKISGGTFTLAHEKRVYPIQEFLIAKKTGNIAVHHGVGVVLFPLFLISIILALIEYKKTILSRDYWIPVTLAWTVFGFIGVESYALPVHFLPGRFWIIITLPIALLSGWGLLEIKKILEDMDVKGWVVIGVILLGILYTSGYPRYKVQTSVWPLEFFHK